MQTHTGTGTSGWEPKMRITDIVTWIEARFERGQVVPKDRFYEMLEQLTEFKGEDNPVQRHLLRNLAIGRVRKQLAESHMMILRPAGADGFYILRPGEHEQASRKDLLRSIEKSFNDSLFVLDNCDRGELSRNEVKTLNDTRASMGALKSATLRKTRKDFGDD